MLNIEINLNDIFRTKKYIKLEYLLVLIRNTFFKSININK